MPWGYVACAHAELGKAASNGGRLMSLGLQGPRLIMIAVLVFLFLLATGAAFNDPASTWAQRPSLASQPRAGPRPAQLPFGRRAQSAADPFKLKQQLACTLASAQSEVQLAIQQTEAA